jgi:hypothetical protein
MLKHRRDYTPCSTPLIPERLKQEINYTPCFPFFHQEVKTEKRLHSMLSMFGHPESDTG